MRSLACFARLGALSFFLATGTAHAEPAQAQEPAGMNWLRKTAPKPAPPVETKAGLSPFRVGAMLVLVAGLGGFAYYARRRRAVAPGKPETARLNVLSSTRVGPKAHAVVTTVGGKRLLLGVTDHSVNVLAWLDAEAPHAGALAIDIAEPAELSGIIGGPGLADDDQAAANPNGFLRLLRSAVGASAVVSPAEQVARSTQDEVKFSRRAVSEARERVEGQAAGILRRKRAPS